MSVVRLIAVAAEKVVIFAWGDGCSVFLFGVFWIKRGGGWYEIRGLEEASIYAD